ncbi:MAG: type 2 isopentenyl-diphosphate Delta-isomerase [Legionellaceae bacterium]
MSSDYQQFEKRKQDHLELALMPSNQADELNVFDSITLVHEALPDLDFNEIKLEGLRLGQTVEKPLMVASMTAGHDRGVQVNRHLMEAAQEKKWAMGVGSQRRELDDPKASQEWDALRRDCASLSLYSNLGIAQLITTPLDKIERLTASLKADALIIHCNAMQETIQPEGTPQFKGCWAALEALIKVFPLPVIVKETGCGFSEKTLKRLDNLGVSAVDVSGLGGTHWGRIEGHRAQGSWAKQQASKTFRNWGINTVDVVKSAAAMNPSFEVWGSGGVRNGLDAAKLFALGATHVGFAKPLLAAALESTEAVLAVMDVIEYELKVALFCTGSSSLYALKETIRC